MMFKDPSSQAPGDLSHQWGPDLKIGSGVITEQMIVTFYWGGCSKPPSPFLSFFKLFIDLL